MNPIPPPTRAHALEHLTNFLPRAADYAFTRNFDRPGHPHVSRLSPHLRCRLLTEAEVCQAVLSRHSFQAAEKFLQEVCWRTYWKGWLEMRPHLWTQTQLQTRTLLQSPPDGLQAATRGATGIDCFDHWTRELLHTGYLHNHARMWYASIWIFTLRLPWQLGADFFYRHLLDADPASNTLGWRWVAGIQTPGKHYLARAENIRKYTDNRFDPRGLLNETASPLPPDPPPPRQPLPESDPLPDPCDRKRRGLLLHGDDLSPETALPSDLPLVGAAGGLLTDFPAAPLPRAFLNDAFNDAARRIETRFNCPFTPLPPETRLPALLDWIHTHRLDELLVLRPPAGPWQDDLATLNLPIPVRHLIRPWDHQLHPHATAGFFRFKQTALKPGPLTTLCG